MKVTEVSQGEVKALIPNKELADYAPDIIVGIERGGLIPSQIISFSLGIHAVMVKAHLYNDDKPAKKVHAAPQVDLRHMKFIGQKVLIVDDVSNSGATLEAVKAAVLHAGAKEARTFALFGKSDFSSRPFAGCVRFPWEGKAHPF